MATQFGFEKLDVWQRSITLASTIYRVTKQFPDNERFGLTNQLRRAACSISANIAEGSGRQSNKDFQRFLNIAYGSLLEVVSHLHIAKQQEFISDEDFHSLVTECETISKMLSGLQRSLN